MLEEKLTNNLNNLNGGSLDAHGGQKGGLLN